MSTITSKHIGPASSRPISRTSSSASGILREGGIVALAIYAYFFVRGLIDARETDAMRHAHDLISIERWLGIYHEQSFQASILDHQWMVDIVNWIYIYGHWPIVIGTLTWLFVRHRSQFRIFRSALILSGLVGFAFFFLFPMAPPRLVDGLGFVDTVTLHSQAYRVLQPPSLTNPYAAMPSLHVGWNLLMGIAIFTASRNRIWKAFGVIMPVAMYLATILTGNHYFLDGVVGSTLVLTALAITWRWSQWRSRREHAEPVGPQPAPPTPLPQMHRHSDIAAD